MNDNANAENENDDHHDCTTSLSATRMIVDHAMELLDPLPPKQLEIFHVAQAYDTLLDCLISNNNDQLHSSSKNKVSLHPRLVHAISTTSKQHENDEQKTLALLSLSPQWIELHADIFRGLLVSSYLLLELCGGHNDGDDNEVDDDVTTIVNNCSSPQIRLPTTLSTASIKIVQQTIERCALLLQVLVQSSFRPTPQSHHLKKQEPSSVPTTSTKKQKQDSTHHHDKNETKTTINYDCWKSCLPPSRYSLVQVALVDDLLPTNTQQQKEWFESLSSIPPSSLAENQPSDVEEGSCGTNNNDDDDEEEEDDDAMVIDMDPSRLAEDEQTLIAMASAEIPSSMNIDDSIGMNHKENYVRFARQGNLELVVPTSTPTTRNNDTHHTSSSVETTTTMPVHVKLFRCGLLWIQQLQQYQDNNNKEEDTTNSTHGDTAIPHQRPQQLQQQQLWCLDTTSTCQLQPRNNEFCFCIQNARNVISSSTKGTITPPTDKTNNHNYNDNVDTSTVVLQVPSGLAEGSAWVNVIQRTISHNMVNHEEMQRLLRNAWSEHDDDKEQYNTTLQTCQDLFQQVMNDTV